MKTGYKWETKLTVPVVDAATGLAMMVGDLDNPVPMHRAIPNAPMRFFFPDTPVVILDWTSVGELVNEKVLAHQDAEARAGKAKTPSHELNKHYWLEFLKTPVVYEGVEYFGCYSWGSSVKNMMTLGLPDDILRKSGLCFADVHFLYSNAVLVPVANFGTGVFEDVKILVLPPGATWHGHTIADGFGLISRSMFDIAYDVAKEPVKLSRMAKNNYQVAQRFDWAEVYEEATEMVKKWQSFLDRAGYQMTLDFVDSENGEYKLSLVEANEDMFHHPYIQGQVRDGEGEYAAMLGSSFPFMGVTRIAVPTSEDYWVFQVGKYFVVRWPVDSNSNVCPIEIAEESSDLPRIMSMVTAQYRFAQPSAKFKRKVFIKGVGAVADDEIMEGYDMIVCSLDIKMIDSKVNLGDLRAQAEKMGSYTLNVPGFSTLAFTQVYGAGTAIGCPIEAWKEMGGDFDGDYATVYDLAGYPKMFAHCQTWDRSQKSYKILKQYRDPTHRAEMIHNSFYMQIGSAVNTVSGTYCDAFANMSNVAKLLDSTIKKAVNMLGPDYYYVHSLTPLQRLEFWRTLIVKIMTDGYKSSLVKLRVWAGNIASANNKLSDAKDGYGGSAPWTVWKKGVRVGEQQSYWAFRYGLPEFRDQLPQEKLQYFNSPLGKKAKKGPEWLSHIPAQMASSTIVRIYQLWKPWFQKHWNEYKGGLTIHEQVQCYPLSHFTSWVEIVHEDDLRKAYELKSQYDAVIGTVQWRKKEKGEAFKDTWQAVAEAWVTQFPTREYGVAALWRACHHARGTLARAGAVFLAFPDDCLEIVKTRPGRASHTMKTIVLGVEKNIVGKPKKRYPPQYVYVESDKLLGEMKSYVCSMDMKFPGMQRVREYPVPPNLIGTIAIIEPARAKRGFVHPPDGRYVMQMELVSGAKEGKGSYVAILTPYEPAV